MSSSHQKARNTSNTSADLIAMHAFKHVPRLLPRATLFQSLVVQICQIEVYQYLITLPHHHVVKHMFYDSLAIIIKMSANRRLKYTENLVAMRYYTETQF